MNRTLPLYPPSNYVAEIDGVYYSLHDRDTHAAVTKYDADMTQQIRWSERTGYFLAKVTEKGLWLHVDVSPLSADEAHELSRSWDQPLPTYQPDTLTKVMRSQFNKRTR